MKLFSGILCLAVALTVSSIQAATMSAGDVTSNLDGTIFFDDARPGGSDNTQHDNTAGFTVNRRLDFDGDLSVTDRPNESGTLTIQSFGLAAGNNGNVANPTNDATLFDVTFTYLGQDELPGGGDDVLIGSERVTYNYSAPGEYVVDFDTDPSAVIDGLGNRIRVEIDIVDNDGGFQESMRLKQRGGTEQSFGHQGVVMSLSGTFVTTTPIPEPSSIVAILSMLGTASFGFRRR